MAFLQGSIGEPKERFSLLLLEPGEIYFEDFSVFYYPSVISEKNATQSKQRGRLKICSKSVVFDPSDIQYPIVKFLLQDVTLVDKYTGELEKRLDSVNKMLMIQAKQVIEMKEGNIIAPYNFKKVNNKKFIFGLNFVTTDSFVPHVCQLQRAATLPIEDKNAMISAIVMSRQSRVKFDKSWLDDLYEEIVMEGQADRISPLVTNPGRIMLTSSRLYFQPFNNVELLPVLKIKLCEMTRVIKRRFLLSQIGLEMFCPNNKTCTHLYLSLKTEEDRDMLYNKLLSQSEVQLEDTGQENMTIKWKSHAISNFEYLSYLNSMADRSINDLTQYPVFPWVIADYSSETLDLEKPATFRDLTKPIGALTEKRLASLIDRLTDMPEPKFLYGSHYSSPGYVLFYLARVAPEYMLCLQNGRFDQADRMFNSVMDGWRNCLTSYSDFKELIPEFYDSEGDFLLNKRLINFGVRQDGKAVNSVELPPWAKDPEDFVANMREALECDYVSKNIHHWIDLIFGYKQRGDIALENHNLFYYLTYEGAIDLESIEDQNERAAIKNQIMEFGQTPKQLFKAPHPQRDFQKSMSLPLDGGDNIPDIHLTDDVIVKPLESALLRVELEDLKVESFWSKLQNLKPHTDHKLHKEAITNVKWGQDGKTVFSVSKDTLLKMYSLEEQRQLRSVQISTMVLSSCIVHPDGKTLIVGSWDNNIYIYSLEYGRLLNTVYAHDDAVSDLCLLGETMASSSWDSTVKLWTVTTNSTKANAEQIGELDHDAGVRCLCFSEDGALLATGTGDGQINIWDVASQFPLNHYHGHTGIVHQVQFSPDGQKIISCGADQYIRVVDTNTCTEIYAKDTGQEIWCLVWDGQTVLCGGSGGDIQVWDLLQVKMLSSLPGHDGAINCLSLDKDGQLVSGGEDSRVIVWR